MKKAILVVSFGTSYRDTLTKTIGAIEADIAAAFPDYEVCRAFTSGMVRRKLRIRDALTISSVSEALSRLVGEGFSQVICQPTHLVSGFEYDDMVREAAMYADQISDLRFGAPLLSASSDYAAVADAMVRAIPVDDDDTALVLMGHGTAHFSGSAYAALDYRFKERGFSHVFVGTVEGYPSLQHVVQQVKNAGFRRALLAPLMVVAGDHAINDMAGDHADSWQTVFTAAGLEARCILRGIGEYAEIRERYIAHAIYAIDAIEAINGGKE